MTVPLARRDPILGRHELRRRRVDAAGGPIDLVTPVSSASILARSPDAVARASAGDHPHWAEVWPASVAVARWIARGPSWRGRRVVDLGCGLGLAGVAAGRRGAVVTFADRAPDALAFAAFNAEKNGVAVHRGLAFDWTVHELPATDVLLLADVAYEYRHHRPLRRHIDAVVRSGRVAVCADPFRPGANDFFGALTRDYPSASTVVPVRHGSDRVRVRIVTVGASCSIGGGTPA